MEYVIIQSPNTHPWKLHFKNNVANTNLLTFYILCWNEKGTQYSCKSRNLKILYPTNFTFYLVSMNMGP